MMLSASLRKIIKSMVRNLEKNLRKSYCKFFWNLVVPARSLNIYPKSIWIPSLKLT